MAARLNRETARNELVRLLKGLDFYRTWQISSIKRSKGTITQEDLNNIVEPGSTFLEAFDAAKGRYYRTVLKEVQSWYSFEAAELSFLANVGNEEWAADIRQFLSDFRREVEFDFYVEAGLLRKTVDKVLKRKRITKDDEYYLLNELVVDVSQVAVSPDELVAISDLLNEFENRHKPS